MKPRNGAIDNALLRIFRRHRLPVNGSLSLNNLRTEWARLPLRRNDLEPALRRLVEAGALRTEPALNHTRVCLTAAGMRRLMRMPRNAREAWALMRDHASLSLVEHRRPSAPDAPHDRRADDESPATPAHDTAATRPA